MTCKFEKKINAYLDGELSEKTYHTVQEHLKKCQTCQNTLRSIIKVNNFLNNYNEEQFPDNLTESILEKTGYSVMSTFKRRIINFSVAASIIVAFFSLLSELTMSYKLAPSLVAPWSSTVGSGEKA